MNQNEIQQDGSNIVVS